MLRWMLPSALLLVLVVAAWPLPTKADEPPTVHEVASGLMCQCGCGMTVATCQESMECGVAASMVQDIQKQIDDGKTKEEILDKFATIYGEEVLALPRKSGFSLMAWVTPFLGVSAGAVVVSAVIWAWVRRRSAPHEATAPTAAAEDLHLYEEQVDEDLRLLE